MKKILSLILSLSIILSMTAVTGVSASDFVIEESFESGMGSFTFASSSNTDKDVVNTSDAASEGSKSMHIIDLSDATAYGVASPRVSISGDTVYTMAVDLYAVKSKGVKAYLRYTDASKKTLVNKSVAVSKEGEWETIILEEKAPADAAFAQIFVMSAGKGQAEAYVDNVRLAKGTYAASPITNAKKPSGTVAVVTPPASTSTSGSGEAVFAETFENGMGKFSFVNSASNDTNVKVTSQKANEGKNSLLVSDDSAESGCGVQSVKIPVTAGETYTLVVDIYHETGSMKPYLRYVDEKNKTVFNQSMSSTDSAGWQTVTLVKKADSNVKNAIIFIMGSNAGISTSYFDNVRLIKGDVSKEYQKSLTEEIKEAPQIYPEWTKINEIDFSKAEVKKTAVSGGESVVITNMAYGAPSMDPFVIKTSGTGESGADFNKNPQKVEMVDVNGNKALYIDSPEAGAGVTAYFPLIKFDETHNGQYYYKFKFSAKRNNDVISGGSSASFYVRYFDSRGKKVGQSEGKLIAVSDDFKDYEMLIEANSLPNGTASISGLLFTSSTSSVSDLYVKDVEVYIKDTSKPFLHYDTPKFVPEKGMHPRVYFTKKDIETIKANATHPQNLNSYNLVLKDTKNTSDGKNKGTGDNLSDANMGVIQNKAFYYAVWGDEAVGRDAVTMMKNFLETANYAGSEYNSQGLLVFTIGAVYDWCYPLLSEEDKKYLQDMGLEVCKVMEIGYPPVIGSVIYGHSAEAQLQRDQMAFALAVSDERMDIYTNIAGRFFEENIDARKFLNEAESSPFGPSYITYRFQWEMLSTYMLKALGFDKAYGEGQEKVLLNFLYTRRPDGQFLRDGDTTVNNQAFGYYDTRGTRAYFLAGNYWKNPYIKGEAIRHTNGVFGNTVTGNGTLSPIEVLCFNDTSVGYKSLNTLPLSVYLPSPKGGMIARTGWAEGVDSPVVVAEMNVDEYWTQGHQHLDAGEFEIYYKGALATDSGYYQAGRSGDRKKNEGNTVYGTVHFHNYQRRTIAHNCMLVYDPNEPSSNYNGYANDGGQLYHGGEKLRLNMEEFLAGDELRVAEVLGREIGTDTIQPDYTYLKGDLQKAYGEKVPEYERSFMFLNLKNEEHPAAMIVFDRVVSKDASFDKKWVLHGLHEPEITGSRTVFKDTRYDFNGKLTVDTLLPKADNLTINTVGGEGKEYLVDGVNYWAETLKDCLNEGGGYRIEVSPKADSQEDYFLNVLQVADADSTHEPLKSEMIESATHTGVKVADRVVLFGKGRDRVSTDVAFTTSGEGWFKYTVADLKVGTWKVTKDGNTLCEIVATKDGGVGTFEASAGTFTLTYLGEYGEKVFTKTPLPENEGINIKVNGSYIYSDVLPFTKNDRTLIPLRAIFENLGATVTWDEATLTATGVSHDGTTTVKITENANVGTVNGKEISLDSPAIIKDGRFLVPVRFIAESLGASVSWDDNSKTVGITCAIPVKAEINTAYENAVPVAKVQQSGDNGAGDVINNSIDGKLSTAWSVTKSGGEAWGVYELKEETKLSKVVIAFKQGSARKYKFSIAVSNDGVNYQNIITEAESSGTSNDYQEFDVTNPISGKYVKFIGLGSNVNDWSNLFEIVFLP